ncbi:MAG TPA: 2-phospho-L-lactate guanylyltransferase [Actinomycetota bacterium]|nr:2-phospho-L-lactate guanylyltransferase [Actinomycetota bacterium]
MRVLAVPVKSPMASKTRLGGILSADERATLTLALFEDVLDACLAQRDWETWVVSADDVVRRRAGLRGARPVVEAGRGLLRAVRQVEAEAAGAQALAVLLGDLPYLTTNELVEALATPGSVVAAPAASDGGTNLLLRRPPSAIPARFGRASFAKHALAAREAGLDLVSVRGRGLEHDLDRPSDLATLLASGHPGRARSACVRMGVASTLRAAPVTEKG